MKKFLLTNFNTERWKGIDFDNVKKFLLGMLFSKILISLSDIYHKPSKIVKVKITYPCQFDDIVKEIDINVPIGLSEEDEYNFIDDVIERDYSYLYGR
jgi:hypothetical protein